MFKTPILFIIFNRQDTAIRVFEKIREVKPLYLYIAADGPRHEKEGESSLCEYTRNSILSLIDWECEVKTLFRDENLGCGLSVSQAITWFFDNVEEGIILEDDCLPDLSFFYFCEILLSKYKDDCSIGMISGFSVLNSQKDYYFYNPFASIWGWATWSRAWNGYNLNVTVMDCLEFNKISNSIIRDSYLNTFNYQFIKLTTWDIQWEYHIIKNNYIKISPSKNLIQNIGYTGTHANGTISEVQKIKSKHINYLNMFLNEDSQLQLKYEKFIENNILIDSHGRFLIRNLNKIKLFIKHIIGYDKKN